MINRFGSSSILLTASSSDFSYLLEGGTGFVRALTSITKNQNMNYKNLSVRRILNMLKMRNQKIWPLEIKTWCTIPVHNPPRTYPDRYLNNLDNLNVLNYLGD